MTTRIRNLILIGGVMMLGACGADSNLTGPETNTPVVRPSYDQQYQHSQSRQGQSPALPPKDVSRYAMAAS